MGARGGANDRGEKSGAPVRERLARLAEGLDASGRLSPERARALLDERARQLATPPEESRAGSAVDVVTLAVADERYAIEARYVREVVSLGDLVAIPHAPEFLLGVTSLRGEIIAVVDLRAFLDVAGRGLSDASRLLVLGREAGEFALLADAVFDLEPLRSDELCDPPETVRGGAREIIRGITGRGLIVLDGAALLDAERLFIDESGEANDGGAEWPERFHG